MFSQRYGLRQLANRQCYGENRTNNGSDVVLGDHRQFKTQRSDPLKTWSYIMSVRHVTQLKSQTCLIGARSGFLAGHGSLTMF